MTALDLPTWRPRSEDELLRAQLAAIDAWNAARHKALAEDVVARSRELRIDVARRVEVIRQEHQALLARTLHHLRTSARLVGTRRVPRAVVVHRNEWFRDRVMRGLGDGGVEVVASLDNGADGVGVVIADQPDLLLVEDKLAMVDGAEVIRKALIYSPHTISAAQVADDEGIASLLDAGARTAFTRRVPPADVAHDLCLLLSA